MKNYIILLMAILSLTSCESTLVVVESVTDGRTMTLADSNYISKVGDTLVARVSNKHCTLYGRYKGVLPDDFELKDNHVTHKAVVRIK